MIHLTPYASMPNGGLQQDAVKPALGGEAESGGFAGELKSKIQELNTLQNESDQRIQDGAVKGATNIHETMIQIEKAEISLRLMTRVRDKALSAYQEVMRMQF